MPSVSFFTKRYVCRFCLSGPAYEFSFFRALFLLLRNNDLLYSHCRITNVTVVFGLSCVPFVINRFCDLLANKTFVCSHEHNTATERDPPKKVPNRPKFGGPRVNGMKLAPAFHCLAMDLVQSEKMEWKMWGGRGVKQHLIFGPTVNRTGHVHLHDWQNSNGNRFFAAFQKIIQNNFQNHKFDRGRRKDFFQGEALGDFEVFVGGPKVVKFVCSHSKLRKKKLFCYNFLNPGRTLAPSPPLPTSMGTTNMTKDKQYFLTKPPRHPHALPHSTQVAPSIFRRPFPDRRR